MNNHIEKVALANREKAESEGRTFPVRSYQPERSHVTAQEILERRFSELRIEIDRLKASNENLESNMTALSIRVGRLETKIQKLETHLAKEKKNMPSGKK